MVKLHDYGGESFQDQPSPAHCSTFPSHSVLICHVGIINSSSRGGCEGKMRSWYVKLWGLWGLLHMKGVLSGSGRKVEKGEETGKKKDGEQRKGYKKERTGRNGFQGYSHDCQWKRWLHAPNIHARLLP